MAQSEIIGYLKQQRASGNAGYFSIADLVTKLRIDRRSCEKQVRTLFEWGLLEKRMIDRRKGAFRALDSAGALK